MTEFDAVSITNREEVLAYSGKKVKESLDIGSPISKYSKEVIDTGEMKIIDKQVEKDVFFQYSIIVPIKNEKETIGAMKFYKNFPNIITDIDIETCRGLSKLYSTLNKSIPEKRRIGNVKNRYKNHCKLNEWG